MPLTKKEIQKRWKENNPEWVKEKRREWARNNPEYRRKYQSSQKYKDWFNKHRAEKRRTNPQYRMRHRLEVLLNQAIKLYGKGCRKSAGTMRIVGCSLPDFIIHIEKQFQTGMSWETPFHIDHIIPCAAFDLSDLEQQKKCFHFTNLRPMWPKDNQRKGAKILC